jgi:hypothetical protein
VINLQNNVITNKPSGNGHKEEKTISWKGPGEVLRPFEGNKGADELINGIKKHKDRNINLKTILPDTKTAILLHILESRLSEFGLTDELDDLDTLKELLVSVKGQGRLDYKEGLTGILLGENNRGIGNKGRFGDWMQRKKNGQNNAQE